MFLKKFIIFGIIFCNLLIALPALAEVTIVPGESTGPYLGMEYGEATGLGQRDVRYTVAGIINVSLGLLGIVCLVLIIYAGWKWMTAGGNDDQAGEAKKIIYAAMIGALIIMSAYAISNFVLKNLFKQTTGSNYSSVVEDNF